MLTIIIPVYNEADNLRRLKSELDKFLPIAQVPTQVLFINDGSKDQSLAILKQIHAEDPRYQYISFAKNAGLSAAIKAGFDYANTPLVGYMDADMQTSPEDFNVLLRELGDYDLVTGVRADRKDSWVKNMSSKIANGIRRTFTDDGMDDTGCPLKIIRTDKAKKIPMFSGLHRFLPAMILLQNGHIKQVPVRHFPRMAGKSNFTMMNRLAGPLSDCFAYLWMKRKYINYQVADKSE